MYSPPAPIPERPVNIPDIPVPELNVNLPDFQGPTLDFDPSPSFNGPNGDDFLAPRATEKEFIPRLPNVPDTPRVDFELQDIPELPKVPDTPEVKFEIREPPSLPDVPTAPPTPDTPEVDFDIRLGDVPDVPQIRDFKAPEIDLDIKFGANGKATLETDFVVEGPAELFKDDDFFNFADGVKKPTLNGFIGGTESPDLSTF